MTPPWLDVRIWVIAILVLGVGIGITVYEIRLSALRGELEAAKEESAANREAVTVQKLQLTELSGNRDQLAGTIEKQNAEIKGLRARAAAATTEATNRALRSLKDGEAARLQQLTADAGVGADAMNRWFEGSR